MKIYVLSTIGSWTGHGEGGQTLELLTKPYTLTPYPCFRSIEAAYKWAEENGLSKYGKPKITELELI